MRKTVIWYIAFIFLALSIASTIVTFIASSSSIYILMCIFSFFGALIGLYLLIDDKGFIIFFGSLFLGTVLIAINPPRPVPLTTQLGICLMVISTFYFGILTGQMMKSGKKQKMEHSLVKM